MIGERVGSYQITDTLGEGGMGAVYTATHTLLGKKAAVKLLLPELSSDQEIVQRFFNEARAATMIQHRGIIEIFDFGYTAEGNAFIVMELLQGEPLGDRIRSRGRLEVAEAMRIVRQIASALEAAHQAGIVHRDLKPDNVFLISDSEVVGGERVKVLDFGIAKLTAGNMSEAHKTRTGSVMGSPSYMSPEQCRGLSTIDSRADIYALGCISYHLLTGRVPFTGEGVGDIIGKHIYETPAPVGRHNPAVSPGVEAVVARCMAKNPDERFQTMAELIDAVDQATAGAYVTGARNRGNTTVPGKRLASSPSDETTLGGAAAQATSTGTVGARRSRKPLLVGLGAAIAVGAGVVALVMLTGGSESKKQAPAPAATPSEPKPDPRPEEITFIINTIPDGAEVYGMPEETLLGTTPFEEKKTPAEGKRVFLVKKKGYAEKRVVIDAEAGGSKAVELVPSASGKAAGALEASKKSSRSKRPVKRRTRRKTKPKGTIWAD